MDLQCKFIGNSMESTRNPHGLVHGMSMEWSIPYGFHMDSIVGMEWKNGWVASQRIVHMESMELGWNPPIPYGIYQGVWRPHCWRSMSVVGGGGCWWLMSVVGGGRHGWLWWHGISLGGCCGQWWWLRKKIVWLLTMPNQMLAFAEACLGR